MTTSSAPRVDLDLMVQSFADNPFPFYEELRAAGRVVWNEPMAAWMVTGFDDCSELLADSSGQRFRQVDDPEIIFWFDAPNMITVDGPEHHRLRASFNSYFTRRAVAKLDLRIGAIVDQLLTPLATAREFQMADFTMIPTVVVAEMFGVPDERLEDFRRWSNEVTGNVSHGQESGSIREVMVRATGELNEYLSGEIERHRSGGYDDLLSAMLAMAELSEPEMRSTAVNILLAGYDTTAKLMAAAVVALHDHPEQRREVVADLSLIPAVIEETLRWSSVAQMVQRVVVLDTELAGVPLAAGDTVYAVLAAANHDPSRWAEPETFDIHRPAKTHLGFGHGAHLCIGIHLARLEAKMALEHLLRVAPDYGLRDAAFRGNVGTRGPDGGQILPDPQT